MDGILSRAELLAAGKRPRRTKLVPIPELGGKKLIVRAMSARERGLYEAQFLDKAGKSRKDLIAQARELLAVECVVDEHGNRMLTPDDVRALGEVDASILDRIAEAAKELSGIGEEDYEELLKNSGATPTSDSTTNSLSDSAVPTSTPSSTA